MSTKFDNLVRALAESPTRRQALKELGLGLAGMMLACFGLANKAAADECKAPNWCDPAISCCCQNCHTAIPKCHPVHAYCELQCRTGCRTKSLG